MIPVTPLARQGPAWAPPYLLTISDWLSCISLSYERAGMVLILSPFCVTISWFFFPVCFPAYDRSYMQQETRRLDIEECVKRMISADLNGTNLDKPSESVVNILLRSHDEHATIDDLNGLRGLVAHLPRPDDSDAANEQSQAFSEILDKLGRNDRTPPGPATWPDNPMEIKDPPAGKHNNKVSLIIDARAWYTEALWTQSLLVQQRYTRYQV